MVNVAILGFGTVGSGVAEVLTMNSGIIDRRVNTELRLKYILDVRDFPDSPYADKFVKDFAVIENDPEVDIVVETIGGARIALEFTTRALKAGKSVVTSNKELVATHGYELLQLAREHGANYLFEASVGGGIPVLNPMSFDLGGNQITEVTGILNGTTNYILTRMIRAGLTFDQALAEAQANGYAEKDPTADVDGLDAGRKTCILAALSFGEHVYPDQVPTEGIRKVTLEDVAYAASADCRIKLLGRCMLREDGKVCAYTAPHLVPADNPLYNVEGVFNGIAVKGNAVGEVMFYGPGAGKLPTASAVVADVMDLARDLKTDRRNAWGPGSKELVVSTDVLSCRWFVRAQASAEALKQACGHIEVLSRTGAPAGETACLTAAMSESQLRAKLEGVQVDSLFRVLD